MIALGIAVALLAPAAAAETTIRQAAPGASTGKARAIGAATELTGTVNPHGLATTYYFEYGPNATKAPNPPAELKNEKGQPNLTDEGRKVKVTVTNFREGTYRLVAVNADGHKEGKTREYTGSTGTKSKKSGFELPSTFQPTFVGGGFTFSGTLLGANNVGRQVVLQASAYPYSAAFATVAGPILTTTGGRFSFHIAALYRNTRFHVATVAAPLVVSDNVTELAEVHVTLKVQTSKHVKGLVRLYGTVSPAATGAGVFIQVEKQRKPSAAKPEKPEKQKGERAEEHAEELEEKPLFQNRFRGVVKHGTRSFSRFSIVAKVREAGAYRAYIQMPAGPYGSGGSATISLQSAKHKATTKKKNRPAAQRP